MDTKTDNNLKVASASSLDSTVSIPSPLLTSLCSLKSVLCHAGTILVRKDKKTRTHRLRVRVPVEGSAKVKWISIKVPDLNLPQVTGLLKGWREEYRAARDALQRAQDARRAAELRERAEQREMVRLVADPP